jgi:TolA-binding protein
MPTVGTSRNWSISDPVGPSVLYCRFHAEGDARTAERATRDYHDVSPMGLGSTAKKVQKLADLAEKMYQRINQMVEQLQDLRGTVDETGERVEQIERELEQHRTLLEAIAEEQDIDVDSVVTDAVIQDAEGKDLITDAEPDDDPGTDPGASAEN